MSLKDKFTDWVSERWAETFGEVIGFVKEETPGVAEDIWKQLSKITSAEEGAIREAIESIADDPEQALSIAGTIAILPTPFQPIVMGLVVSGAMGSALQFALMDKQTQKQWEAQKPLVTEQALAQWEAQKQFLPEQIQLQTMETLKYIDIQTRAQWDAQRPLLVEQGTANVETRQAVRPNPMPTEPLFSAWFRGIITEEELDDALRFGGYRDDYIAIMKQAAIYYPPPSDLITFVSREVFEPASIERYGLLDGIDSVDPEPFLKGGMTEEQLRQYWIAHWQHASETSILEMFRRDVLVDPENGRSFPPGSPEWAEQRKAAEDWYYSWFNLVEMAPVWRKRKIAIAYEPFTRVDTRRMWDLGVMDDDDVLRNMLDIGYPIEAAKQYLLWIKVETRWDDIIARFKNGYIERDEVQSELIALGVSQERALAMFETRIQNLARELAQPTEKDLTATDITKLVNKDYLAWDDAVTALMNIGFDASEAPRKLMAVLGLTRDLIEERKALRVRHRELSAAVAALPAGKQRDQAEAEQAIIEGRIAAIDAAAK